MLAYWWLGDWQQISMQFTLICANHHSRKDIWKCYLQKKRASCFVLIVLDTYPSFFSWLIILYKPYVYTSSCKSSIIDFRLISKLSGTPKISRSGKLYILHEGFYVMEREDWPPTTFFSTLLWSRDGDRPVPICENIVVQWNLSVTTTSMMEFITCDLFSNVF